MYDIGGCHMNAYESMAFLTWKKCSLALKPCVVQYLTSFQRCSFTSQGIPKIGLEQGMAVEGTFLSSTNQKNKVVTSLCCPSPMTLSWTTTKNLQLRRFWRFDRTFLLLVEKGGMGLSHMWTTSATTRIHEDNISHVSYRCPLFFFEAAKHWKHHQVTCDTLWQWTGAVISGWAWIG